jgi:hypothetical protein
MPKRMTFKDKIKTRSGRCFDNEIIYVTTVDGKGMPSFVHGRRISRNRIITKHNILFGESFKQTVELYKRLPLLFIDDLNDYAQYYNNQYREGQKPVSGYNLFIGVLMRHQTQIFTLMSLSAAMGNTINEWIENGELRPVNTTIPFNERIV